MIITAIIPRIIIFPIALFGRLMLLLDRVGN
jgi:hypothetical protein